MDFSTNRHSDVLQDVQPPSRHPGLSFDDGNIALLTGSVYFVVHQGVLARHSEILKKAIEALKSTQVHLLEDLPVLSVQESPQDMFQFLLALYDGISSLTFYQRDFPTFAGLLRLASEFQVNSIRSDILRALSGTWPSILSQWDQRESMVTYCSGLYKPRQMLPHPILIINLARQVDAPEILPSAFYDLCRSKPSEATFGYTDEDGMTHHLSDKDLRALLLGREHASRFLSTFIVNHLEGVELSDQCLQKAETLLGRRNKCLVAFEAVTFDLLRDINGVANTRNVDALYLISEAELILSRGNVAGFGTGLDDKSACTHCRADFGELVDLVRHDFWSKLPLWFGLNISDWGLQA